MTFARIRDLAAAAADCPGTDDQVLAAANEIRGLAWDLKEAIFERRMAAYRARKAPRRIPLPTLEELA